MYKDKSTVESKSKSKTVELLFISSLLKQQLVARQALQDPSETSVWRKKEIKRERKRHAVLLFL